MVDGPLDGQLLDVTGSTFDEHAEGNDRHRRAGARHRQQARDAFNRAQVEEVRTAHEETRRMPGAQRINEESEVFRGLRDAGDVFGYDPDVDEPDDEHAIRKDWMNRMVGGLLPPDESHGHRRYDLTLMEVYGQGVYDPGDPRHPLRWFDRDDRDDLRERYTSELVFVGLPEEGQEARTAEALNRMSESLRPGASDNSR
ncbi:hypothetical protein [Streptomyces californicus]|uniref:hypothetical protein n=1 Tax=Streptomyces californicus TaxID=67351 RepID=UPI0036C5D4A6